MLRALVASFVGLVGLPGVASDGLFFVEDFASGTAGPNLALGTVFDDFGGPVTVSFAPNAAVWSQVEGSRVYLGTRCDDYARRNIAFLADVTISDSMSVWSAVFMGMGSADATGQVVGSGEPDDSGPNNVLAPNQITGAVNGRLDGAIIEFDPGPFVFAGRSFRLVMRWDPDLKRGFFQIFDLNSSFEFGTEFFFNDYDGERSQLFVGGGDGLVVSRFEVRNVVLGDACSSADLAEPFGTLDLADVDFFISEFVESSCGADVTEPFGTIDLGDVDAFIAAFLAGCP